VTASEPPSTWPPPNPNLRWNPPYEQPVRHRWNGKTVLVLLGLTVVAYLAAIGTFDVYLAILANLLLLATLVTSVVVVIGAVRRRRQH